jgi:hypothetical protein
MTTTTIVCDRCREEIPTGRTRLSVEGGVNPGWSVDSSTGRPVLDLCPDCAAKLVGWLAVERQGQP